MIQRSERQTDRRRGTWKIYSNESLHTHIRRQIARRVDFIVILIKMLVDISYQRWLDERRHWLPFHLDNKSNVSFHHHFPLDIAEEDLSLQNQILIKSSRVESFGSLTRLLHFDRIAFRRFRRGRIARFRLCCLFLPFLFSPLRSTILKPNLTRRSKVKKKRKRWRNERIYLNTRFGQIDAKRNFFAQINVGIMSLENRKRWR